MIKSAYIHIPFCKKICSYCDFPKVCYQEKWIDSYLNALKYDIETNYNNDILDTIYIGGGTPSSLSTIELNKLFVILKKLKLNKTYEYTIETNIEDLTEDKIKLMKSFGINRVSIGVQTFNDKHLKTLNRNSNYEDLKNKIDLLKNNGIDNINLDLMYALPNQKIEELNQDLNLFLNLNIKHISTYSLILEEHTKLYIDKTEYIDEDLDYKMYNTIENTLKNNNYEHYEVSNYCKEGYESKHNLTYWNNNQYYGFGMGASSYIDNIRINNTKNITTYLNKDIISSKEELKDLEIMQYEMILGLRKIKGVNKESFKNKYSKDIKEVFDIKELLDNNKLIENNEYIYINPKYIYLSNDILVNFI